MIEIINNQQSSFNQILSRYRIPTRRHSIPTTRAVIPARSNISTSSYQSSHLNHLPPTRALYPIIGGRRRYIPNNRHRDVDFNNIINHIFHDISSVPINNIFQQPIHRATRYITPTYTEVSQAIYKTLFSNIVTPLNHSCPISLVDFSQNDQVIQLIQSQELLH